MLGVLLILALVGASIALIFRTKHIKPKKLASGVALLLGAGAILFTSKVAVENHMRRALEDMDTVTASDDRDAQTKLDLLGYGVGAIGLVFLLAGLVEMKPEK